jgi:tetratricopeptide (TPR) repeat protein
MDPRQLQRFHNEARAAASLEHPHIVPVYGVGCERGVHYYAMKFIDGQSLAELLAATHQLSEPRPSGSGCVSPLPDGRGSDSTSPLAAFSTQHAPRDAAAFRQIAEWGIQAAEALEHGHSIGIVHRDIKPANLLIDGHGALWVTDFGLARTAADAGLTMTGDVLGTLRYMSPEQALARHGLMDHRTDVYSLGATLYELLTGRPAIEGQDRQELMRQIASEEPRTLRRLNKAIPAGLETIVLKALEKDPGERYATAQALADDLRRFLEDRPVHARRPGLVQHGRKWVRRHRAVVAAAVGVALVALGLFAAGLLWHNAQLHAAATREAEQATVAAQQRDLAREQGRRARQAVNEMYTQVAEEWLAHQPHLEETQRQFLEKALHYYEEFALQLGTEPAVQLEAGEAYLRVGNIQRKLRRHTQAEEAYGRAIAGLNDLVGRFPKEPAYRNELAEAERNLGMLLGDLKRTKEAEEAYGLALALWEKLSRDYPEEPRYQVSLATILTDQADMSHVLGRDDEAETAYRRVIELLEKAPENHPSVTSQRLSLARGYTNLAILLLKTGQPEKTEEYFRKALTLCEKEAAARPSHPFYQDRRARIHRALGGQLDQAGRYPEAAENCGLAISLYERLAKDFPCIPDYRLSLAAANNNLAGHYWKTQQLGQAKLNNHQALAALESLVADYSSVPEYRQALARTQSNLSRMLADLTDEWDEPLKLRLECIATRRKLAEQFPQVPDYRHELALELNFFGALLLKMDRLTEAEKAYRESIDLWQELIVSRPRVPDYRRDQANSYEHLAKVFLRAERPQEAETALRQFLAVLEECAAAFPNDPDHQIECARHLTTGPLDSLQNPTRAVRYASRAVQRAPKEGRFWTMLGIAKCRAGDWRGGATALETGMSLRQDGDSLVWFFLAMARWRQGNRDEARKWYDQAVQWMDKHPRQDGEALRRLRAEAAALLKIEDALRDKPE